MSSPAGKWVGGVTPDARRDWAPIVNGPGGAGAQRELLLEIRIAWGNVRGMMKRLLCLVALTAFGVAAQAGDPSNCSTGCCQSQATSTSAPGSCCAQAKVTQTKAARANKAGGQHIAARKPLQSPKAASLAS